MINVKHLVRCLLDSQLQLLVHLHEIADNILQFADPCLFYFITTALWIWFFPDFEDRGEIACRAAICYLKGVALHHGSKWRNW